MGEERVALVLATSTGGVGQHVRSLAGGLVARGVPVTVAGPAATEEQFAFTAAGAAFAPVEISTAPRPLHDLHAVRRLRAALDPAAVVHAHGLRAGFLAGFAAGRRPLVVTWHNAVLGAGPRRALLTALEARVARRADVTLGASLDLVARARSLGARDARLSPVAAPPFPPPTRSREDVRRDLGLGDRPVVLSVGRVAPQKRYDVLLGAAARWAAHPSQPLLLVAGEGPERGRWERHAQDTGVAARFLGHRDDVADLLRAADLLVLTSEWEARALVVQEAVRAGLPVVATAVGGIPELLGDAGVLVPWDRDPGTVADGVAAAVVRLLDDPQERARLGRRAAERAAALPSEQDTVEDVRAVHRELLAR